jgi:hypothetical protein
MATWDGSTATWDGVGILWDEAGGPVDITAPTVLSATISGNGSLLALEFSEPVTGSSGFTLSMSGGAATLAYESGSGYSRVYTISRVVYLGETGDISYAPGDVEDLAGNVLEAFTGAVVNGSTQLIPAPTFLGFAALKVLPSGAVSFDLDDSFQTDSPSALVYSEVSGTFAAAGLTRTGAAVVGPATETRGLYLVTVRATDMVGQFVEGVFRIEVGPFFLFNMSSQFAYIDRNKTIRTAGRFIGPVTTYSITAGTLPTGLAMSGADGIIGGIPTVLETQSVTVRATSGGFTADSNSFSITIREGRPPRKSSGYATF